MRAKSKLRLKAEKLREEQGLSYKEISALTGVNKSTLSGWLHAVPLKPELEARLQKRLQENRAAFAARALPINRERYQLKRQQSYQAGVEVLQTIPTQPSLDELAFAMLYLGEGTKRGGVVQIANTDPQLLKFFLWALRHLYAIAATRLSFRLNLVEIARPREEEFISWWVQQLWCARGRFMKSQFDPRSRATQITGDYHGVCTITCNDTYLQQRIWGLAHAYLQSKSKLK